LNTYGYAGGNPTNQTDTLGLIPDSVTAACSQPQNIAVCIAIGAGVGQGVTSSTNNDFPRPGVIPDTIEHRGELNTPAGEQCPINPQDPRDCGDWYKGAYNTCRDNHGTKIACHIRGMAAWAICAFGGGSGGDYTGGGGESLPPGYYLK